MEAEEDRRDAEAGRGVERRRVQMEACRGCNRPRGEIKRRSQKTSSQRTSISITSPPSPARDGKSRVGEDKQARRRKTRT
ncbi:hypothetical protein HPP92_017530 [Vanilla planifolia]|uniref:Uncharacterized protein n=1 Tax=Vanilla planifolia TaxID=51239 RepID=A0A835USC2_VANPL|nr:hypothetical protein HPP92_017530 [Vanilla planifolia]